MSDAVKELDEKLYSIDLPLWWWTKEKIKRISKLDCLSSDLSEWEFKAIVLGRNEFLIKKVKEDCKDEEWNVWIWTLRALNDAVIELDRQTKRNVAWKIDKLLDMSEIWVYSDWLDFNSPFDLVSDIEEIDEIVFEKDFEYEWDKEFDLSEKLKIEPEKALESTKKEEETSIEWWSTNKASWWASLTNSNKKTNKELEELLCKKTWNCAEKIWQAYREIKTTNICNEKNNSWLSWNIEKIIELSANKKLKDKEKNNENSSSEESFDVWEEVHIAEIEVENPESEYEKIDDWDLFPCSEIFCIKIDFETYEHNLLWWWWWNTPSIEYIINRSNEHLKKFMNSFLWQSKMTINKGELDLKDINLMEMFNMKINIRYEPVPILELTKENEKKEEVKPEYNLDNMFEQYYKQHWLDYKQQNDISEFLYLEEQRKSNIYSRFANPAYYTKLINDFHRQRKKLRLKEDIIRKTLKEEARTSIIENLKEEYKQIKIFSSALNYYVNNLNAILDKLLEIPVDKWRI